jgi:hypothetical protein
MTLNYWMMVERYPNLKEEVGGSIPGREISSPLDKKLARWSIASCALALTCQPFLSQKKRLAVRFPPCEISSLLDRKLGQVVSCLLCFGIGLSAFCLKKDKKE